MVDMIQLKQFRLMKNSKAPTSDWRRCNQKKAFTTNTTNKIDLEKFNIGYPCGEINDIFVLDLDFYSKNKNGDIYDFDKDNSLFLKTFSENYIDIFNTFTVSTPNNGYHLYFKFDNDISTTTNSEHQIDIRSNNSYIVAPESTINNNKYKIINNESIKPIPLNLKEWLLKELYTIEKRNQINNIKKVKNNKPIFKYNISDAELDEIISKMDNKYWTNQNDFLKWTSFMKHLNQQNKWDEINKTKPKYNYENNINNYWNTCKVIDTICDDILNEVDNNLLSYFKYKPVPKNKIKPNKIINSKKLGYEFLNNYKSDIIIKSDTGTGKTTSFLNYIKNTNKNFISIVSRISLGEAQYDKFTSEGLNCKFYLNHKHEKFEQHDNIIITIDSVRSLYGLDLSKYIIFLDEYNSLIEYLHTSTTLNNTRYPIYRKFIKILNGCTQIICVDADISDISIEFYNNLNRKKHIFIQNEYKHNNNIKATEIKGIDELINKLIKEPKFLLCTDSKASVDMIKLKLNDPDVITITSDNTEYINLDNHSKIIYSPKIVYGLDSNMKRPVYCYYKECTIPPSSFLQQICRCRDITQLYYCCIKKQFISNIQNSNHIKYELENSNTLGIRIFEEDSDNNIMYKNYKYILSKYLYMNNCYNTNKFAHLINLLDQRGFNRTSYIKYTKEIKNDKKLRKELKLHKEINFDVDSELVKKINDKYLNIPYDEIHIYKEYFINQSKLTNHFNLCRYINNTIECIKFDLTNRSKDFICNKIKQNKSKLIYLKKLKKLVCDSDNIEDINITKTISDSDKEKLFEEYKIIFNSASKSEFKTNQLIQKEIMNIYRVLFGYNLIKSKQIKTNGVKHMEYTINSSYIEETNILYSYRKDKNLFI
tara:strand:- start:43 stop:2673 length:2631 start_codon:yes stop_codon:yes gene_type:complete